MPRTSSPVAGRGVTDGRSLIFCVVGTRPECHDPGSATGRRRRDPPAPPPPREGRSRASRSTEVHYGRMGRVTTRRRIVRRTAEGGTVRQDTLAVEEPLQIRVDGQALTVTMRTPGDDMDLVHGFLLAEGIASEREHVRIMRYCAGADEDGVNSYNVIDVELGPGAARPQRRRSFLATSACGVCGTTSIDDVETVTLHPPERDAVTVDADTV